MQRRFRTRPPRAKATPERVTPSSALSGDSPLSLTGQSVRAGTQTALAQPALNLSVTRIPLLYDREVVK